MMVPILYSGNVWWQESLANLAVIHQTLTSQNLAYIWHPYGLNLSIYQTLFHQTFPLYGTLWLQL